MNKPTYRISTTAVESYRLFKNEDWFDFEKIKADLSKKSEQTDLMLRGSSLHEILECPPENRMMRFGSYSATGAPIYRHLNHSWSMADIDGIELTDEGKNEIKVEHFIEFPKFNVLLVAKVDKLNGYEITDYKTTESAFDADKYMDSIQWKIYCLIFGAKRFIYRIFELSPFYLNRNSGLIDFWQIKDEHILECVPYLGMENEIRETIQDFVYFCLENGCEYSLGIRELNYD